MMDAAELLPCECMFPNHWSIDNAVDAAIRAQGFDPRECEIACEASEFPELLRARVTKRGVHACWVHAVALDDVNCEIITSQLICPWSTT